MTKRVKIPGIVLVLIGAGVAGYFFFNNRNAPGISSFPAKSISQIANPSISEKPSEIKEGEICGAYRYTKPSGSDSQKMRQSRAGLPHSVGGEEKGV